MAFGRWILAAAFGLAAVSCSPKPMAAPPKDIHSYANPTVARVTHLDLDCELDFAQRILTGAATLAVERAGEGPLILDTRSLAIHAAETSADGRTWQPARFELGAADPILGAPLTIDLPPGATRVRITYATSPAATALQWLDPVQTAGGKHPFLFTQSQAIHARSWIPLQDSPGVRISYTARVRTPPELAPVMSARKEPDKSKGYKFSMPGKIPPYLIALAAGDIEFRSVGPRTGVWAERPVIGRAAREFEDMEAMLEAAERLYGPYRWHRYDVLVLPPSFPFGGMENPMVTFATPTILAGDKSLVSLIAHELAHSWSGNLVTNATWSDFWLNEGFTTYVERRIVEEVYGPDRARMEAVLGKRSLLREIADLPPKDQVLHIDLAGRDPDDAVTDIPYEKGALLLATLEHKFGRERFDRFLAEYFATFAFQSITTETFAAHLRATLFRQAPAADFPLDEWLYQPGVPASAFEPQSEALARVETQARNWAEGRPLATEAAARWTTQEWLHFLQSLPAKLTPAQMKQLDEAYHFTQTGNSEILCEWLRLAIRHGYREADARVEQFLRSQGRRKYVKPIYEELAKTPAGKERARRIYRQARPTYHPITIGAIDRLLA